MCASTQLWIPSAYVRMYVVGEKESVQTGRCNPAQGNTHRDGGDGDGVVVLLQQRPDAFVARPRSAPPRPALVEIGGQGQEQRQGPQGRAVEVAIRRPASLAVGRRTVVNPTAQGPELQGPP